MQSWVELCTAIMAASGVIAGALKLLAHSLGKSIGDLSAETKALRAAMVDNTHAVTMNNQLRDKEQQRSGLMKKGAAVVLLLALLLLAGCPSVPQQTVRDMEFAEKAWEEDKATDLEPDVITARRTFFKTAIETARKGAK